MLNIRILMLLWFISLTATASAQVTIKLITIQDPSATSISVEGCSPDVLESFTRYTAPQRGELLQAFVKVAFDKGNSPAMLGTVTTSDKAILFKPRFPLSAGVDYLVRFRTDTKQEWQTQVVSLPKKQRTPSTFVKEVYPTASVLPQNLLKFYVYFSAPMTQGEAYAHVELQGPDGKRVAYPFLEIEEELWDKSGQRLTLLMDPARVKRGLVPREEDGPILSDGSRYRLIIKSSWPDAQGTLLTKSHIKTFTVGPEDFKQPDEASWKIKPPKSKTRDALTFIMPEPMDHATFARGVTIENDKGQVVLGDFTFSHAETQAHFTPLKDWRPGLYDVRIWKRIEDLAGNSIDRPFELDRFDTVATSPNEKASLTIEIQ